MIQLENLGKHFEGHWIFRGLSLEIKKGQACVLIGPSGQGKSVLLKLVAGLLTPDEGKITAASPNVGMLFQRNALFDSFTVRENLEFPLREILKIRGREARERSINWLREVGLEGSDELYPDELSGGMQKRLGIARALIVEPEVILYDEPTAGLDPITSRKICDLINDQRIKRGTTLLAVTNDVMRAQQLGDNIFLLAQGTLIPAGTARTLRSNADPRVAQFVQGLVDGPLTENL